MAFAKATENYWSASVATFKGRVGDRIQVRWRSRPDYDLMVRPSDSDQDIFVLVLGKIPALNVVGWIRGGAAKQDRSIQDHGGRPPAWFVPQDELISDLAALRGEAWELIRDYDGRWIAVELSQSGESP